MKKTTLEELTANPPAVYNWTGPTGVKFVDVREPSGTYYRNTTPRQVIDVLERAMSNHTRIRLFYGKNNGKCWHEENDVCGYVGRSSGPIKCALLIANNRSSGGGAILTDRIVKIMDRKPTAYNSGVLYEHPKFDNGRFSLSCVEEYNPLFSKGYRYHVRINGKEHANFKTLAKAQRWIDFMQGKRMGK